MTYGELKETEMYINAEGVDVCVNGGEPIDEEYFYFEDICLLDNLPVVGTGNMADGTLHVDLVCTNWDQRFDDDTWVPEYITNEIIGTLKCKIGFTTVGFTEEDKDGCYDVNIKQDDIVNVDQQGYLWKDGICFAHKDSKIGKENFVNA